MVICKSCFVWCKTEKKRENCLSERNRKYKKLAHKSSRGSQEDEKFVTFFDIEQRIADAEIKQRRRRNKSRQTRNEKVAHSLKIRNSDENFKDFHKNN
ncbi:hypothetical protein FF38_02070 [Lucilia cuprina]|uniref:Uncharacterized protein n=1 Tax=Lucilia cuprina TaxID=7375 RepID=A0A0L0BTB6_LUCCU|nr:hypothetical protein FF38_02070 [Lucilia cuprina]